MILETEKKSVSIPEILSSTVPMKYRNTLTMEKISL